MLPDSSNIDNAVVAKLGSDATLLSLCPNGVYWDIAPDGMERFVIVSMVTPQDVSTFGGTAYEDTLYAIKAVMSKRSGGDIQAAAARIHTLLHDQPLAVQGYEWMAMHRDPEQARIRGSEQDPRDLAVVWFHRGGYYRVQMAVST